MKRITLIIAAIFGLLVIAACTTAKDARLDDGTEFMTAK